MEGYIPPTMKLTASCKLVPIWAYPFLKSRKGTRVQWTLDFIQIAWIFYPDDLDLDFI